MSSSGRKSTKVLLASVAALLLFIAGFAAVKATSGANQHAKIAPDTIKALQAQLKDYLKKDTELSHWKLISQKITPTSQQVSGEDVMVIFDVERTFRDDYAKVDDEPVMKGQLAFLKDYENQLSQHELAIVNQEIEELRSEYERYITTDQGPAFERIKAVGKLDSNGKLLPNTVKLYLEGDGPDGKGVRYVPCSLVLKDIPTPEQVERDVYNELKRRFGK